VTSIGHFSQEEYEASFPIDLGEGVRACYIGNVDDPPGLIVAHMEGDQVCAASMFWRKAPPIAMWTVHSLDPLHLEPSLKCSCGHHGFIREGKWQPANF